MPPDTFINPPRPRIFSLNPNEFLPQGKVSTQGFVPGTESLNEYDTGLREGMNQPYVRGANQTALQQMRNAALRFVPSVAAKLGEGAALTGSLVGEAAGALSPDREFDWGRAMDSPFAEAFRSIEEWSESTAPIYGSKKYLEGNLADKLWTTSFWTQDAMDGIEFLTSAYVPGVGISKIGSLGKAASLSKYAKVRALGEVLNKSKDAMKLVQVDNLGSTLLTTVYNTTAESMVEGSHLYKEVKEDLKKRFPTMSEEEIESKASKAARNTFGFNMLYLAIPNFLQTTWMHGTSNFAKMRSLREAGKLTEKEVRQNLPLAFAKGFASEGLWEENIQTAVTELEKRIASGTQQKGDSHASFLADGLVGLAKAVPDIFTLGAVGTSAPAGSYQDQAATAALLGGIIGGPMSLWSAVKENKGASDALSAGQERVKSAMTYIKKASDIIPDAVGSVLKNFGLNEEDGSKKWSNIEGEQEYDTQALRRIKHQHAVNKALNQEAVAASVNGDPIHLEAAKEMALTNFAWELADLAMQQDLTEDDIAYLIETRAGEVGQDKTSDLGKKAASQLGIDGILTNRKQDILDRVALRQKALSKTYSQEDFSSDEIAKQFHRDVARAIYYAENMNNFLTKAKSTMPSTNEKALEDIEAMIEDNTAAIEYFSKASNRTALKEQYRKEIAPALVLQEEFDKKSKQFALETISENKDKLSEELEDIAFQLEELSAIEGTQALFGGGVKEGMMGMFPVMTSNMFGPRQAPHKIQGISMKQAASWVQGNNRVFENEVDKLPSADDLKAEDLDTLLQTLSKGANEMAYTKDTDEEGNPSKVSKLAAKAGILTDGLIEEIDSTFLDPDELGEEEYLKALEEQDALKANALERFNSIKAQEAELKRNAEKQAELVEASNTNNEVFFKTEFIREYNKASEALFAKSPIMSNGEVSPTFEEDEGPVIQMITRLRVSLRNLTPLNTEGQYSELIAELTSRLDALENKILPFILNKAEQRQGQQKAFEKRTTTALLDILTIPGIVSVLTDIEPEWVTALEALKENPLEMRAYQHVLKIMDDIKKHARAKEILEAIEKQTDTLTIQKINELSGIPAEQLKGTKTVLLRTKASPEGIYNALYNIIKSVGGGNQAFEEFRLKTRDIYTLVQHYINTQWQDFAENQRAGIQDSVMQVFELTVYRDSLQFLKDNLNSKLNLKDLVEAETALLSTENSPTFQQRHTALWLLNWIFSPFDEDSTSTYVSALRGIIGTGKTKLALNHIVKILTETGRLKKDEILLVGHSEKTSNQLNKILKGVENENTILDYLSDPTTFAGKKLIIVDEAAAIEDRLLNDLKRIASNQGIKIIFAGDSSQNTVESAPDFTSSEGYRQTIPLSVVYRTNIAALTNAALQFKDKLTGVQELTLQSNKKDITELKADPSTALGVMNMQEADVIDLLNKPSNRSRILIVANENEVLRLSNAIKHTSGTPVEVVNYLKVQGTEADEVYIILPTNGINALGTQFTPETFNTAMYTSIGRATKFAGIVTSGPVVKQLHISSISEQADSLADDFKLIKDDHIANLNELRSLYELSPITVIKPSEQDVASKEDENVGEDEDAHIADSPGKNDSEDTNDGDIVDNPTPILDTEIENMAPDEYLLSFPTNSNLPTKTRDTSHVDYSQLYIVRSTTTGTNGDILVVAKHKQYEKNGKVIVVAVLGNDDLDPSVSALGKYLEDSGAINKPIPSVPAFSKSTDLEGFSFPNIDSQAMAKFPKGSILHSIAFDYGNVAAGTVERVPVSFNELIPRFIKQLFFKAKGGANLELDKRIASAFKNSGIDWKELANTGLKLQVRVFNRVDIKREKLKDQTFVPKVGVPYLEIKNLRWESKTTSQAQPNTLYIRLNPKKYNSKDIKLRYMTDFIQTITSFRNSFKEIKALFPKDIITINGKTKTAEGKTQEGLFSRMLEFHAKNNFEVSTSLGKNKDINYTVSKKKDVKPDALKAAFPELNEFDTPRLDKLIEHLDIIVPLVYGTKNQNKVITFGEWLTEKTNNPDSVGQFSLTTATKNKKLKEYLKDPKNKDATPEQIQKDLDIKSTDNINYTQKDSTLGTYSLVKEQRITRGEGPLQIALDVIASANTNLKISENRTRVGNAGETFSYGAAKTVFSSINRSGKYYAAVRTYLTEEIGLKVLKPAFQKYESSGKTITDIANFLIEKQILPMDAFGDTELLDGSVWNGGRVRVQESPTKGITFAYQDKKGNTKPLAILLWADVVIQAIENAESNPDISNIFGNIFKSSQEAKEWKEKLVTHLEELAIDNQTSPLEEEELDEILEHNETTGEYKNIYTPLIKTSKRIPEYANESIEELGKLDSKEGRELLESMLTTSFKKVMPTRISIKLPKVTAPPVKATPTKGPVKATTPTPAPPQTPPKAPTIAERLTEALSEPDAIEATITMEEMLKQVEITDSLLAKLRDLLLLNQRLLKVPIVKVRGWAKIVEETGTDPAAFLDEAHGAIEKGSIVVHDFDSFVKKPQNLIHEAIHAEVNNALLDPQSEQDQQLGKELEYLFTQLKSRKTKEGKDFKFTESPSGQTLLEFLPSLTSKLGKEVLEAEPFGKPKSRASIIWKQIWEAIITYLSGKPDPNFADATVASFEKYMKSKYQTKENAVQVPPVIAPPIVAPIVDEEESEKDRQIRTIVTIADALPEKLRTDILNDLDETDTVEDRALLIQIVKKAAAEEGVDISKLSFAPLQETGTVKEGVEEVFNENPELANIGTQKQYSQYLDTIFLDSKVKDIKQHTTEAEFESFTKEGSGRLGKGFYFSDFGNNYIEGENVKKKLVLLNIKNPLDIQGGQFMKDVYKLLDDRNQSSDDIDAKIQAQKDINNQYKQKADALVGDKNGVLNSEIKVFESEQIHILGSKQDIEGFKSFVQGKKDFTIDSRFSPAQLSNPLKSDYYDIFLETGKSELVILQELNQKRAITQVNAIQNEKGEQVSLFHYADESSPSFSGLGRNLEVAKQALINDNTRVQSGEADRQKLMSNAINMLTEQEFFKKDCK